MKLIHVIVAVVLLVILGVGVVANFNENEYTATVTDKQVKRSGESDMYLVFTESEEGKIRVFKNTDSLLRLKFNSSNIQGSIKVGETYTFKVIGFRIGLFSMYENIIEVTK